MKRVVIESPLAASNREDMRMNLIYAKRCIWDSLKRGEAPYASHVFFNQPLLIDDMDPRERELGMTAGFAWGECADLCAVYTNLGISPGMQAGIDRWRHKGIPIEFRSFANIRDMFYESEETVDTEEKHDSRQT